MVLQQPWTVACPASHLSFRLFLHGLSPTQSRTHLLKSQSIYQSPLEGTAATVAMVVVVVVVTTGLSDGCFVGLCEGTSVDCVVGL